MAYIETINGLGLSTGTFVTPEMFGAVGDGVTDDTAAIQAALDYGVYDVRLNSKTYLVTDTLTMTKPRYLHGAGTDTKLYVNGSFDTTKSILRIAATKTAVHDSSYHVDSFSIMPSDATANSAGSGTIGGIGIECRVEMADGAYTAYFHDNLIIENVYIGRLAGVGIFMNNVNATNGFFSCIIQNNNLNSGFKTNRLGDGCIIRDNMFQGIGEIYLDGISGQTANSSFVHNVVTCGCIYLAIGARNFTISDNQIELANRSDLTQSAAVVVGSSFTKIVNNNIYCIGSNIDCVRFNSAANCCIYDNLLVCDDGHYWIYNNGSRVVRADGNYPSTTTGALSAANQYYCEGTDVITGVYKQLPAVSDANVSGTAGFVLYADGMLEIFFELKAVQAISAYTTVNLGLKNYISKKDQGFTTNLYCGQDNVRIDHYGYNMYIAGNETPLPANHYVRGNIINQANPF